MKESQAMKAMVLRMPHDWHETLVERAIDEGIPLNQYLRNVIQKEVKKIEKENRYE